MAMYRWLLRLYPASFRNEYGDELARVFAQRVADRGRFIAWVEALGDIVRSALAVHADILAQDVHYTARAMRRAPGLWQRPFSSSRWASAPIRPHSRLLISC